MKSFFKVLVTVVVILVIVFTVCFFIKNMSQYNLDNSSGDLINDDLNAEINNDTEEKNGDIKTNVEQNKEQEVQGGDNEDIYSVEIMTSGENITVSGENHLINDWEPKIESIKEIENQNKSAIPRQILEDKVGIDIMGTMVQDFLDSFETDELAVNVQIAGSMVYIIPTSDFIDNIQFHYDKNGNLILYIREFIGVGGEARYYFENGTPIIINMNVEEKRQMQFEYIDEILQRSEVVYDRYMK